jgi:tight adherence protein B
VTLSIALFFLITFAAVAACLAGVRWFSTTVTTAAPEVPQVAPDPEQPVFPVAGEFDMELLRDDTLSTISVWAGLLKRFDWVDLIKRRLQEAGMAWSVGRLTMLMLVAGASTFGTLRMLPALQAWLVLLLSAAAAFIPYLIVLRRRTKRLRKIESQLPDALDTMARALRAGNPVQASLELLARETPSPLGFELRKLADERAFGMPLEEALDNLVDRVPVSAVSEFAAAIGMQIRTGGKLHEILARLTEGIRENQQLRMEIEAISAHGKMTGLVLTLMPVAISIILTYTNHDQMALLWGTSLGRDLVAAAGIGLVAAHFVIRKLVDIRI